MNQKIHNVAKHIKIGNIVEVGEDYFMVEYDQNEAEFKSDEMIAELFPAISSDMDVNCFDDMGVLYSGEEDIIRIKASFKKEKS